MCCYLCALLTFVVNGWVARESVMCRSRYRRTRCTAAWIQILVNGLMDCSLTFSASMCRISHVVSCYCWFIQTRGLVLPCTGKAVQRTFHTTMFQSLDWRVFKSFGVSTGVESRKMWSGKVAALQTKLMSSCAIYVLSILNEIDHEMGKTIENGCSQNICKDKWDKTE